MTPNQSYLALAQDQHGLVTRSQLTASGLSLSQIGRRVKSRILQPLLPGVYRSVGSSNGWHQRVMAACLWAESDAAASHETAATLWGLDGFSQGMVHIVSAHELHPPKHEWLRVHSEWDLQPKDFRRVDGIPTTSVERTLIDLAAVCTTRLWERALDHALVRRLTTAEKLSQRLRSIERRGRANIAELHVQVAKRCNGFQGDSTLESDYVRITRAAGLPTGRPQVVLRDSHGDYIVRADFFFPEHGIVVLCDGYQWHGGRRRFEQDLRIRNRLQDLGYRILHVTYDDVRMRPESIVSRLRSWLHQEGPSQVREGQALYCLAA
jgi:very-short-patch-repair endonuclease